MQRHTIEPRPGWQETVEAQGVIYPLTRHPDDSLRPYWDESAYYSFSLAEVEALLPGTGGAWDGLRVLVTAGGTREPIDPVRYIANRSSGRQGFAIAASLAEAGA